jgi:import inner membrane translocase subunit TIM50
MLRVKLLRVCGTWANRCMSSDSVLGGPKIESPFNNPNRVLRAHENFHQSVVASKREETHIQQNTQQLHQTIAEHERDRNLSDTSPPKSVENIILSNASYRRDTPEPEKEIPTDNSSDGGEKKRQKMAKNTYLGLMFVLGGTAVGLVSFCVYYGSPQRDSDGKVIPDEFSDQSFGFFYRILNSFKLWRDYVVEPSREVLLPDPIPYPYHQPKYTLVIEMKNILVSPEWTYKTGYRFKKRPALDYFLDVVGYPNFEVVIYTSESSMTAPSVVESMDPKGRIMYKLYRDTTKYMNGHHVKDLSKLNRDLTKVIYIDFDPKSFQLNPENVLRVPKWEGNMEDTALVDLAELLKTIHLSDVDDVRPTLQYYSQFDDPSKEFRRRAQYLAEQEEKKHHQDDNQSALKRYSGKLFGFRRHNSV